MFVVKFWLPCKLVKQRNENSRTQVFNFIWLMRFSKCHCHVIHHDHIDRLPLVSSIRIPQTKKYDSSFMGDLRFRSKTSFSGLDKGHIYNPTYTNLQRKCHLMENGNVLFEKPSYHTTYLLEKKARLYRMP